MKLRLAPLALVFGLLALPACADSPTQVADSPGNAASFAKGGNKPSATLSPIPITGVILDAIGGTFNGTFTPTQFVNQNGTLALAGTLTGTLTDAAGNVLGTVTGLPIQLPVNIQRGTCRILSLDLGPLDLNLLGLRVQLSKIDLDITGQTGAGNLLGNLLCAVAGLLDSGAALDQLVNLLNQLLGAL